MRSYLLNQFLFGFIILKIIMVPSVLLADDNPINTDILEIKTLGKKWLELYRSSNIEKFMDQYTEDALVALNGKPALKGKEAIQAYFESRIGKKNVDMRLDYEKISINQNIAVVVAKFYLDYPFEERIETVGGRSLIVYKKSDLGKWLIDVDIDQKTPDAN
ncbi:Acyl-CoA dehydrogenase protein [Candidatus Micropelagos thuwalensis]|uniref:Acyl-CoA dehydrogenase protein n=2 Tax=Candidatus Micropelagius thuwalensis TaxID=1397666 RepID=U2WV70_9PROT|nr:Acyl-CoA dehydrogenase protein [Candidatus Micropelagos thuwalensis]